MKRRGMYSSNCFFKPFIASALPRSVTQFNNDSSWTYPYIKGRPEDALFGRSDGRKEDNDVSFKKTMN